MQHMHAMVVDPSAPGRLVLKDVVLPQPATYEALVGIAAISLAHPVPPIAAGQASTTRGASNKKACQVRHSSPIYPSWREGCVQAAQEWGKQIGTSETVNA